MLHNMKTTTDDTTTDEGREYKMFRWRKWKISEGGRWRWYSVDRLKTKPLRVEIVLEMIEKTTSTHRVVESDNQKTTTPSNDAGAILSITAAREDETHRPLPATPLLTPDAGDAVANTAAPNAMTMMMTEEANSGTASKAAKTATSSNATSTPRTTASSPPPQEQQSAP